MKINKVHCMFEQSGTFKNAFINLGIPAEDYDIFNDFGQTDHVVNLFTEIEKAYDKKESIFDKIESEDLVFAFFPCTRFESQITLSFRGESSQFISWSDLTKIRYAMGLHEELHELYILLCKLFVISMRGGWRLIVENPYTQPHYLAMYFPIKPKVIIYDRRDEGDYQKKPTQFFFVNCDPEQNIVMQPILATDKKTHEKMRSDKEHSRQVKRSLIHPQFADRFIKTYILTKEGNMWLWEETNV